MDDADRKDELREPRALGRPDGPGGADAPDGPDGRGGQDRPRGPDGPRDPIETVLQLTGPRPAVPADRAERVRDAVHAHWRGVVDDSRSALGDNSRSALGDSRSARGDAPFARGDARPGSERFSRRRFWPVIVMTAAAAAVLVAVIGRGLGLRPGAGAPPEVRNVGRVEAADGQVRIGAETAVRPGSVVMVGSELSTEGGDGRLAIRMASGHSVRLGAGSRLRVLSPTSMALDHGIVYVDSLAPGGPLMGRSRSKRPSEASSRWELSTRCALAGRQRARPRARGAVSLKHRGGAFEVAAVTRSRSTRRVSGRRLTSFDGDWGWIRRSADDGDRGRSAREFLDWIARERGLQVRSLFRAGGGRPRITLNGRSRDDARPGLASVLPTCGMAHRIDQGVLWVASVARNQPARSVSGRAAPGAVHRLK
jgi:hypothetical protein